MLDFLKAKPSPLCELRRQGFVRRKIGVGFLPFVLKSLISKGKIACTTGVFWARATTDSHCCVKCGQRWNGETGKYPCSNGGQCEIPAAGK